MEAHGINAVGQIIGWGMHGGRTNAFLLRLDLELADKEAKGQTSTPPGLPAAAPDPGSFVTEDCIRPFHDIWSRPSARIGSQPSAGKGLAEIHKMRTFQPWLKW
jgi:hypothetical protein